MAGRKKAKNTPEGPPSPQACDAVGCVEMGEYRAPRSRESLHDYRWLCLEHIREHNQKWNYFTGMSAHEIEAFMHDAVTGHRPTWAREDVGGRKGAEYRAMLEEELRKFLGAEYKSRKNGPRIHPKERRALAALELERPCTPAELKKHYRALVKRTHPDLHAGDRTMEEKFKAITASYTYLLALYERGDR